MSSNIDTHLTHLILPSAKYMHDSTKAVSCVNKALEKIKCNTASGIPCCKMQK